MPLFLFALLWCLLSVPVFAQPEAKQTAQTIEEHPFGKEAEADATFGEDELAEEESPAISTDQTAIDTPSDFGSDFTGDSDIPAPLPEPSPVQTRPWISSEELRSVLIGNSVVGVDREGIGFTAYFVSDGRLVFKTNPGQSELATWSFSADGRKLCTIWDNALEACYLVVWNGQQLDWYLSEAANAVPMSRTVLRKGNAALTRITNDPAFRLPNYTAEAGAMTAGSMAMSLETY